MLSRCATAARSASGDASTVSGVPEAGGVAAICPGGWSTRRAILLYPVHIMYPVPEVVRVLRISSCLTYTVCIRDYKTEGRRRGTYVERVACGARSRRASRAECVLKEAGGGGMQ